MAGEKSLTDWFTNKFADSLLNQQCSFVMTIEDYEQLGVPGKEDWRCQQPAYENGQCIWHLDHRTKDWSKIKSDIPWEYDVNTDETDISINGEGGLSIHSLRLDGADFQNFNDSDGAFYDCSLIGAQFNSADLYLCPFGGNDLRGADFSEATLDSNFGRADLRRACFDHAEISKYTGFKDADLRGATFNGANLPPAEQFEGAVVEEEAEWLNDAIEHVVTILSLGMGVEWTYKKTKGLKNRIQERQEKEEDSGKDDTSETTGGFEFGEHSRDER